MPSKVYFISVKDSDAPELIKSKFDFLLDKSNILDFISGRDKVALKLHFGEEGNTGFVKPQYVRQVCERILKKEALPILTDTNTLYRGRRTSKEEHLKIAYKHGFTKDNTAAEVEIASDHHHDVEINQKFIQVAHIASFFSKVDKIISIAHFKGHIMTGFGGALKNIGMGCATRTGKLAQHSDISPIVVIKNCIGCGKCVEVCPAGAIILKNKKAYIDNNKCIGCASCIAACPNNAIDVNWEAGGDVIQEKMIEYAYAVLKNKPKETAFINFALKITKECDCLAKDDPKISPDVGILVSSDPVSIDQASFDLVVKACAKNVFKEVHPERDGSKQLEYAAKLGLGSLDYELIELCL